MPKQTWVCELCSSLWPAEEQARCCESSHKVPVSFKVLRWCDRGGNRAFPLVIKVKLDLDYECNYATYKLDHIGPRGC